MIKNWVLTISTKLNSTFVCCMLSNHQLIYRHLKDFTERYICKIAKHIKKKNKYLKKGNYIGHKTL